MKYATKKALEEAEAGGATPAQLKQLKAMLSTGAAKDTKKYPTAAERKAKQKMQKASRKKNRNN